MCRVLSFPAPPDKQLRDLLSMIIDDLQILAIHDRAHFYTAAQHIAARADALRVAHGTPLPPASDDLQRLTASNLRLLALYPPELRTVALEVGDLAQPIRIRLASGGAGYTMLLPLLHATLILSGLLI